MSNTVQKELNRISRAEERLRKQAHKESFKWRSDLEKKVPGKVISNLQVVFRKAFEIIFDKGTPLIEKTYKKEEIQKGFLVHDFAIDLEMSPKDLLALKASSELNNLISLSASAVEGISLGALGIGLPDIVLFISLILRGCYETALEHGFDYDSPAEKYFILTVLEGSMLKGDPWDTCNDLVDSMMDRLSAPSEEDFKLQLGHTSDAFAVDMLLAKFIQGIPVVGVIGGLTNPVYYRKILKYVKLKYRKRYLLTKTVAST
jgi:hypothetical protein